MSERERDPNQGYHALLDRVRSAERERECGCGCESAEEDLADDRLAALDRAGIDEGWIMGWIGVCDIGLVS